MRKSLLSLCYFYSHHRKQVSISHLAVCCWVETDLHSHMYGAFNNTDNWKPLSPLQGSAWFMTVRMFDLLLKGEFRITLYCVVQKNVRLCNVSSIEKVSDFNHVSYKTPLYSTNSLFQIHLEGNVVVAWIIFTGNLFFPSAWSVTPICFLEVKGKRYALGYSCTNHFLY